MLFDEIKKIILQLNNSKRFYRINGENGSWIYDSHSHNIFRLDTELIEKGIITEDLNVFTNISLEAGLRFLSFCYAIKKAKKDYIAPLPPNEKCTVMINTSNRCNLNCSYCFRAKSDPAVNNADTIKKTLEFVIKKHRPEATQFIISYSMTSESSIDLPILKQVAEEYINFENYQFIESDIEDFCFMDFYKRLEKDLKPYHFGEFPREDKKEVIKYLNSLLGKRDLMDILNISESMFNERDKSEFLKRRVLGKWRIFRLNRWGLEILYDKYIQKRRVPFVAFGFMTNGTCSSQEYIDFIKACDVNPLWISIDGPKDVHNANRKYNTGNGSYDDVIKNVKIFRKNGIELIATAVVTANFPRPLEIINHLQELGFNQITLTPVRPGCECSFNEINVKELLLGYDEIYTALEKSALKHDFRLFYLLKQDMSMLAFYSFYQKTKMIQRCEFNNQIVVDSKGEIYPCVYFTDNKDFCYGNIYDGIDKNKIKHDIYINHREKCNECWARYLCGGTCLYASYKAKGNHLRIDPIECTIKKHMAERCMKLIVFLYEHNISLDEVL